MKKRNDNGSIHIIAYLLILIIFAFTVYACLDIFEIINVPEKYSVAKWLNETMNGVSTDDSQMAGDAFENISKNVIIQVENPNGEKSINIISPSIQGYSSSGTQVNSGSGEIVKSASNFTYYDQLDEYGKIIYKELEKNLDNMKSGTYNVQFGTTFNDLLHEENGEETLNNSFQLAINALNFDNSELFYIDISKIYLLTKTTTKIWGTTYEVEIGASQGKSYLNSSFSSEDEVNQAMREIENEKVYIESMLRGSIENQIKTVHDYLIDNLEYDSTLSKDNIYNIYGALINKSTVCEGYARAFKSIMDDLNIPCLIACGTAVNSAGDTESHAWNYVRIDNKWYAIDVTWDDPVIVGTGYVSSSVNYKYYLKGSNEFFTNHTEDGDIVGDANFKYPTLSTTNY